MTKKNHEKDKNHEEPKNDQVEEKQAEETGTVEEAQTSELDEKIQSLEKEVEDYKEKLLRKAAEFENYKRRTEVDQLNLLNYSSESLIIKLLPIIDDFERSLQHMDDAKDVESIKTGVKLVYDKLMKILDEQGVKKIEAVGQPFNVELHEAVMQRKDENTEPHTVLDELEKGYMYKDKVIRHTKVIVSEDTE
jgi:molecular chaperone GrpE